VFARPWRQFLREAVFPEPARSHDRWITLSRLAWRGLMLGGIWGSYAVCRIQQR
jgi:hypothetical protein